MRKNENKFYLAYIDIFTTHKFFFSVACSFDITGEKM